VQAVTGLALGASYVPLSFLSRRVKTVQGARFEVHGKQKKRPIKILTVRRMPRAVDRKLILLDITGGFANLSTTFASGIVFEFSGHVPGSLTGGISGHSSVGRAQASQAWGRGFEPRCPLQLILQARPNSLFEVAPSAGVIDFELRTLCWCCLMRFAV
jgi:hypothetical protein